ncbi:hypothetical protein [Mesorhizobium sp. M0011]|uniref:hypothetical protein n=1 Tax=Mesorhizobium sp. M0011 TaxID=2956839 RepID=UPI003335146B
MRSVAISAALFLGPTMGPKRFGPTHILINRLNGYGGAGSHWRTNLCPISLLGAEKQRIFAIFRAQGEFLPETRRKFNALVKDSLRVLTAK